MIGSTWAPRQTGIDFAMHTPERKMAARFMLWVDGVGGYLATLADEVVLGQAVAGNCADIPIIGDLSRYHATIVRESEGYVIRPHADTRVCGVTIRSTHVLCDGDELQLGDSFVIRFRKPHPLSNTCRLDFLSHHRTQPASDGVILMANSCILGRSPSNHVTCRHWTEELILVRHGQQLRCHTKAHFEIDGVPGHGQAPVGLRSRISGEDFCLSLEQIV